MRKDLDWIIYLEPKRHNVSHYIYYLATDNIHIVLENDNTVLIKGLKKVVNVKFSRNTHLIETSYDSWNQEKSHFSNTGKIAKAGAFRWVNIHEHKRYYYTLIIHYYLLRAFRTLHKSFINYNVRFLPVSISVGYNAIRVRAKPCVHRFNYSRTLPQRSSPSGCGHS